MKIIAGVYASFEGMCWTLPTERMSEIAWKAHWGEPTKPELMLLASAVSSYAALINMPERLRRVRIKQLREALKMAASQGTRSGNP